MKETQKALKIVNASAGSGKTYTLVRKYLLLLLAESQNALKFSEIMAMTFTNKAAFEMKTRILKQLDELSYPDLYGKKSTDYASELAAILGLKKEEIHERAGQILTSILYHYESFHVLTIDKFNVRLIRSFSFDLDLPSDFEVILKEDEIIEQVVDKLLAQIGRNEAVSSLLFSYANSKSDDEQKWDIRRNIVKFAKVIKNEANFSILELLKEKEFSTQKHHELRDEIRGIDTQFFEKGKAIHNLYLSLNLDITNLPGASTTANRIDKLGATKLFPYSEEYCFSDTFIKNCENDPKKDKVFPQELRSELLKINEFWLKNVEHYEVLKKYEKNYFNMAVLNYLVKELEDLRDDEHLIRISEFNNMISKLITQDDAPFIYERLGNRYRHYMLDEFQDTSRLQWMNLTPLLHESLGNGNENLIVGDPKQSIYRFKNGLADQFVALPKLYNPENDKDVHARSVYFDSMGVRENLGDNWRSAATIVDFNTSLFEAMRATLSQPYSAFYESVKQNPKSSKNGLVVIRSEEVKKKPKEEEVVPFIIESIQECVKDGFKLGEICILGQRNKECSVWANALSSVGYKVVSADSLFVSSDERVKLVFSYFKLRLNPNSPNENKQFAAYFCTLFHKDLSYYQSFFREVENASGAKRVIFDFKQFITDNFKTERQFYYKFENLYDLVQQVYKLFGFDELNNPFLHHFADMLHNFQLKNGPDLQKFVSDFMLSGKNESVQLPESDDAIKLMTIHKSKGLEFPVVIVPSMNGGLEIKADSEFFIEAEGVILYTNLTKKSKIKGIQDKLEYELSQRFMDVLNLYYVAFTRPIERLYVSNVYTKNTIGERFYNALSAMNHPDVTDVNEIRIGNDTRIVEKETRNKDSFFIPAHSANNLWFPDIALQDREELVDEKVLSEERLFGTQFHLAISRIDNPTQIKEVIDSLVLQGEVEAAFSQELIKNLGKLFGSTEYVQLFENATKVLNEQDFIVSKNEQVRPDKIILKENETIVVDYKTGIPNKKDIKQVKLYKKVMEEVGYSNVKGYLFYTSVNRLELVA